MDRLYGLDALRGMAALVVLFMHVFGFAAGHLAVDFFFMLSGYVMARTYEERLASGALSPMRFMAARYRRLWPPMAAGVTLGFAVYLVGGGTLGDGAIAYGLGLLMVPAGAATPFLFNLAAWSIFYELLANAGHAALFARMGNRALIFLLGLCAAALVAAMASVGFPRILAVTGVEMQLLVIPRAFTAYLIGILAFRLLRDRPLLAVPLALGVAALPAYAVLVAVVSFPFWQLPFILAIAPLMLVSGLRPVGAGTRLCAWIGKLSFPLYALHVPTIQASAMAGLNAPSTICLCLSVAMMWMIAERRLAWRLATRSARTSSAPTVRYSAARSA